MEKSSMLTHQGKLARVDREFLEKLRKVYPSSRSDREATNRLNTILDEMLYGKQKKIRK